MFKYSHVLYAVDLSDMDLDKSIKKVVEAAKASNTKVTIVHYVQSITDIYDPYYSTMIDQETRDNIVKAANDKLLDLVSGYDLDKSCLFVEAVSNIKVSLVKLAKELEVDAIYLNGHNHNIIGRLGSVADYIINKAECDVTILK